MKRTTRKRPSAVPLEGHRPAVDSQGELHLLDLPSVEKAPPGTLVWYEQQLADLERALPALGRTARKLPRSGIGHSTILNVVRRFFWCWAFVH